MTPPPYPSVESSREATHQKLARNVAALFGVPVRDSRYPDLCWFTDYPLLNLKDLARGTPPGWDVQGEGDEQREGSLDKTPVASATLSKFGPDVKAAAVLAGANTLFEPMFDSLVDVLEITYQSEDDQPLADATRITLWAALQLDIFMAQPALMWAVYQARTTQRATNHRWRVQVDPQAERVGTARRQIEFAIDAGHEEPSLHPRSVDIMDDLLRNIVKPEAGPKGDGVESLPKLVDNTATRFVAQLMRTSTFAGWARLRGKTPGHRVLDVYVDRGGLHMAFMEENLRIFNKVQPYKSREDKSPEAVWEDYDASEQSHWLRLIPRVPSKFEVRRLAEISQVALVRALRDTLRCLAEHKDQFPTPALVEIRHRLLQLSELSSTILGEHHHETHRTYVLYLELLTRTLDFGIASEPWDHYSDLDAAGDAIAASAAALRATAHAWPPGEWLECWDQVSTSVSSAVTRKLESGDSEGARQLGDEQVSTWISAFAAMGFGLMTDDLPSLDSVGIDTLMGLATPLHDCMANLLRPTQSPEDVARGRRLAFGYVKPVRTQVSEHRRSDRPLRLTLQVLLGHFARCAEEGEAGLLPTLRQLRSELLEVARVQFIAKQLESDRRYEREPDLDPTTSLRISDFITLRALVWSAVVLLEQEDDEQSADYQDVNWQLEACRLIVEQNGAQAGTSRRAHQYRNLLRRWVKLQKSNLTGDNRDPRQDLEAS